MKILHFITILTFVSVGVIIAGCKPPTGEKAVPATPVRKAAEAATLEKIDGSGSVSVTGARERPALFYFLGTWTDSHAAAIKWLEEFPADGMDVIPVIVDKAFAEQDTKSILNDMPGMTPCLANERVLAAFGNIRALPTAVLVGKDGSIRNKWQGFTPIETVLADIRNPEPPVSKPR